MGKSSKLMGKMGNTISDEAAGRTLANLPFLLPFRYGSAAMNAPRLILASQSARRRELMNLLGLPFETLACDIDETPLLDEPPIDYVRRLSIEKAQTAATRLDSDTLITACDTTVADGAAILGKPAHAAEARAMFIQLRGRTHVVHTAITMVDTAGGKSITQVATSPVVMRDYTDAEIEAYVASGDPFDKAG